MPGNRSTAVSDKDTDIWPFPGNLEYNVSLSRPTWKTAIHTGNKGWRIKEVSYSLEIKCVFVHTPGIMALRSGKFS